LLKKRALGGIFGGQNGVQNMFKLYYVILIAINLNKNRNPAKKHGFWAFLIESILATGGGQNQQIQTINKPHALI